MRKAILLFIFVIFVFVGCTSNKQEMIVKSKKSEAINPIEVKKTSKDYGSITVYKHEQNLDNKTKVFLSECRIKNSIDTSCYGYMYEVMYDEEWLVHSHKKLKLDNIIEVSSNKYYLKLQNIDNDKVYNVTGILELKAKHTNYVKLELE